MLENKLSKRMTKITSEFNIGNSTVTNIKKNESRIQLFVSMMENLSVYLKECKIMHHTDDEKVDEAVYLWYIQRRSQGILITGLF